MASFFFRLRGVARYQAVLGLLLAAGGCQWFADDADRQVYQLIDKKQQQALGEKHEVRIARGKDPISVPDEAYAFVPHPTDSEVPEAFHRSASQPAASSAPASMPTGDNAEGSLPAGGAVPPGVADGTATQPSLLRSASGASSQPATTRPARTVMTLSSSLRYAFQHSRQFQNAKEDLYLAALELTLERHLWTPRFFSTLGADYTTVGLAPGWDQAFEAVSEAGVRQKLPYGGEVTARILGNMVRDLATHVSSGETGSMILEANVPLLRGAGKSAYESRYQAERNLIYAVRTYEQYRRSLAVEIAGLYFNLQQLRQQIVNARESVQAYTSDGARAEALWRTGRIDQLDVLRTDQDRFQAINAEVDAVASYETSLDRFKIALGMPMETRIDVEYPAELTEGTPKLDGEMEPAGLEDALKMPDVSEKEAIRVGLKYRLDLLNDMDRVDDARRGVSVAENHLLPDLVAYSTVQLNTDPTRDNMLHYSSERAAYKAGMRLEVPLDRVAERNALRRSQISLQQAQRSFDEAKDVVSLEVRSAMREVQQQMESLEIQTRNRDLALVRRRSARLWFELGKVNNRDVVEAQRALLDAQNRLAEAQASFRLAILAFRNRTGTLRIDDEGQWYSAVAQAGQER
jgi:outer membrane protein TolC